MSAGFKWQRGMVNTRGRQALLCHGNDSEGVALMAALEVTHG